MATFHGERIFELKQMEVGGIYLYFHPEYDEGFPFLLTDTYNNEDSLIYIGDRIDKEGRIALQSIEEQKMLDLFESALYVLREK